MGNGLNLRVVTGLILSFTLFALIAGYMSVKKLDANDKTITTSTTLENQREKPSASQGEIEHPAGNTAENSDDDITTQQSVQTEDGTAVAVISQSKWYLTYVGRNVRLPDDFKVEISPVAGTTDGYHELDTRVVPYWDAMYNTAKADGYILAPFSGHRRISTQKTNYENLVAQYVNQNYSRKEAEDIAARSILPPGTSEHNLGLAMDIVGTNESFEQTKEFKWLMENAANYGFILRYPKDKQHITNIKYEPWHWRYVGKEAALAMKASGECLEEYLNLD